MRIAFLGTPDFAARQLETCAAHGDLVLAVSQPDRPVGRHQKIEPTPVKRWAIAHGIPVEQPAKVRNGALAAILSKAAPDVAVVAAYGRILPPDALAAPRLGCLNVHASLLPRYRGAAPIQWAIANGERETGVTIMQMDEGLDTGDIRLQHAIPIAGDETSATMHDKLATLGAAALGEALTLLAAGNLPRTPQDNARASLAPLLTRDEGRIDWTRSAAANEARRRGFTPWPGAFFSHAGENVKVHAACVAEGKGAPGEVISVSTEGVLVACGTATWLLRDLQPEGGKRMEASAWAAGRAIAVGSHLSRP